MKYIAIVRVHTKQAHTFTSNDFYGYRESNNGVEIIKFLEQEGHAVEQEYFDDELDVTLLYLKDYEWNRMRDRIVSTFTEGIHPAVTEYWDKQEVIKNGLRFMGGFVIFKKSSDLTTADYKGALAHSFTPAVRKYASYGHAGGYLGHQARKIEHDLAVEEIIGNSKITVDGKDVNKWKYFGTWLTSNDARHWMDGCENMTIDEFKKSFRGYVEGILLRGYIYTLKAHRGTLKDTIDLMEKYKDRIVVEVG